MATDVLHKTMVIIFKEHKNGNTAAALSLSLSLSHFFFSFLDL
jgi:hypothetical protein